MTNAQREMLLAPSARYGVEIGATDATGMNLHIDIKVTKRLGLEISFLEVVPCFRTVDLEAIESLWVNHIDCDVATMGGLESWSSCCRLRSN
jgi:hypothetical protein